ncbi:MAG TPA: tetratricopeptide repeat protein [Blastocatellia bacterium]
MNEIGVTQKQPQRFHSPLHIAMAVAVLMAMIYMTLVQMNRKAAETNFQTFVIHLRGAQYKEAERDITAALARCSDDAYYHSNQGLLSERVVNGRVDFSLLPQASFSFQAEDVSRLEAALSAYNQATAFNPNDACFYHNIGWLYWLTGDKNSARHSLRKATEIDPDVATYHVSLGLFSESEGDLDSAASEYAAALRGSPAALDSRFFRDLNNRSAALAGRAKAMAIANLEVRGTNDEIAAAQLGRLYLDDDQSRARELLSRATELLPNLSRAWLNLGTTVEREGDSANAERCYRKAVFLDKSDYLSASALGAVCEREGHTEEAISWYSKAIENWDQLISIHALRAARVYNTPYVVRDDIIPRGLLAYTEPELDRPGICLRLAALYERTGDPAKAAYFRGQSGPK